MSTEGSNAQVFVFPLSFQQQRLWFLDQLNSGTANYNISNAIHIKGQLDVEALHKALQEIVRRHEALRTTFQLVNDEPCQIVAPSLTLPLPVITLDHVAEPEREAEARRQARLETERPFDLARGPLLRVALLRLTAEEHIFLL